MRIYEKEFQGPSYIYRKFRVTVGFGNSRMHAIQHPRPFSLSLASPHLLAAASDSARIFFLR